MIKYSTARDIDDYADKVPDRVLACRVDQHSKIASSISAIADLDGDSELRKITGAYAVKTKRCRNRCGVVWLEVVDRFGHVIYTTGATYHQAPEYLTKGLGRMTTAHRDRLRLEQIQREIEG